MLVSNLLPGFTPFLLPAYEFNDIGEINAASLGSDLFVPPPVHRRAEVLWHSDGRASAAAPKEFLWAAADEGPKNPPPPDKGALRYDALEWQREREGRSLEEALLVKVLGARIRLALWSALSEGEPTDVSRAILKSDRIAVKITQTHDGLRDYEVALFARTIPYMNVNQVIWTLDLKTGALEPVPYAGHASHLFGPFYRNINFRFAGLTAAPLIQALPPERRQQSTPPRPRPAASPVPARAPVPAAPAPDSPKESAVVLHYQAVRAALMRDVIFYAEAMDLPEKAKHYLISLANTILRQLHKLEYTNPAMGRQPVFHIWIRDHWKEPSEANVEVNKPGAFIGRARGPHDILLVLIRFDHRDKGLRPYLGMYGDLTDADRLHSPEAWFLKKLGLETPLQITNIEALHPDFKPA